MKIVEIKAERRKAEMSEVERERKKRGGNIEKKKSPKDARSEVGEVICIEL